MLLPVSLDLVEDADKQDWVDESSSLTSVRMASALGVGAYTKVDAIQVRLARPDASARLGITLEDTDEGKAMVEMMAEEGRRAKARERSDGHHHHHHHHEPHHHRDDHDHVAPSCHPSQQLQLSPQTCKPSR